MNDFIFVVATLFIFTIAWLGVLTHTFLTTREKIDKYVRLHDDPMDKDSDLYKPIYYSKIDPVTCKLCGCAFHPEHKNIRPERDPLDLSILDRHYVPAVDCPICGCVNKIKITPYVLEEHNDQT